MSTDNPENLPVITFQEAFNQAINSLDLKGTLQLMYALNTKALMSIEEKKSNILKPVTLVT